MMRSPEQLFALLHLLLSQGESEVVEFKEANDNFPTSEIGKYFSALANEANLRSAECGWLVFGVRDKTRSVVGTTFRQERARLMGLKQQIADGIDPATTFRDIHELHTPEGRVLCSRCHQRHAACPSLGRATSMRATTKALLA
jgi:ATP-dependent DNA helicase RecG